MPSGRILVTGANGFVGAALVSWLRKQGRSVRAAVRTVEASRMLRGFVSDVVVVGEIGRSTDWGPALDGIDVVIHLAGRAHVLREASADPLAEFRAINVQGTTRLAEQAAGRVRRLVFVSSIGVNGSRTLGTPFSESSPAAPDGAYAMSKHETELELRGISESSGLEVVTVRPPLVYGPECPGNFLRLLKLIRSGIPLPLASIRNARSFVYVKNLASALLICAEHPFARGRTYLVDDGRTISTPELVRTLGALFARRVLLVPCPVWLLRGIGRLTGLEDAVARLTDSLIIEGSAIRRELGWTPPYTMRQGLAETAEWYRNQSNRIVGADRRC